MGVTVPSNGGVGDADPQRYLTQRLAGDDGPDENAFESWYGDGENALFQGTESQLADFVKDDLVRMKVVSFGSFSYDTQAGGNTTVPLFQVDAISLKGSCGF